MSLKNKLKALWDNRDNIGTITEGMFNAYVACGHEVKDEALRRLTLCRSNQCSLYDPHGQGPKAVFKGKESCGGCGCDLYAKAHAMSAHCYLKDAQLQLFRTLAAVEDTALTADEINVGKNGSDAEAYLMIASIMAEDRDVIGPGPLWEEVITTDEEKQISEIAYRKQVEAWQKQQNQQNP